MIIRFSSTLSLMARYLYQRGDTFHFCLRVPKELVDRYPQPVIRQSLKTKDPIEATRLAGELYERYRASFSAMRGNPSLTPADTLRAAQVLADTLPPLECDADFFDRRFHAYLKRKGLELWEVQQNPELVGPSDYLSPVEVKALELLQRRSETRPRLSAALDVYVSNHKNADNRKTMERARRDWGLLTDLAGDICIEDLGREHARMYVAQCLAKGLKTTSTRRAVNTVSAIFNTALRELDIRGASNPFSSIQIANEDKDARKIKTPSAEELSEILTAFREDTSDLGLIILIQMGIGCRVGEVSGLASEDVVLDAEVPYLKIQDHPWRTLKTKTSSREVPLVGFALEAARGAAARAKGAEALFPRYAKEIGNTLASAAVNKRLKRWAIGSHGFRHGMKDLLREAGCPEPIQKAIQGHAGDGISSGYGKGYSLKVKQDWLIKAHALIPGAVA